MRSNNGNATTYLEVVIVEETKISYKGLTGHWTKWGGARSSVWVNQHEPPAQEWVCQSCAQPQPKELTPMRFQYPEHEYIRVCAICFAEDCLELFKRINST